MDVLIVEDHAGLREDLILQLNMLGFSARGASSGAEMQEAIAHALPHLIVMDIGLPDTDGFTLVRSLATHPSIGVVFLTARRDLEDRLRGLEEGGDAYLVKPVDIRELASTLRAVDRRIAHLREPATEQATPAVPAIENGTEHENWILAPGGWHLQKGSSPAITLSASERTFMQRLTQQVGTPVSREEIARSLALNPNEIDFHRIEMLVSRLRSKVKETTKHVLPIKAVRGQGYLLLETIECLPYPEQPPAYSEPQ